MKLRTATYNTETHKIVPSEPTKDQLIAACTDLNKSGKAGDLMRESYQIMIAAAPDYKENGNET